MRKVSSTLFVSLDGVAEAPEEWQFEEDFDDSIIQEWIVPDAVLLGRRTYQEWADYWPKSTEEPFASFINKAPKYVVSTTLDSVDWDNTTLIKGNLPEELAKLKGQPGGTIGAQGSPTLVRSLVQDDLLDELVLIIHPVVAGKGKRLFDDVGEMKRLKLADSRITGSGIAVLTYQPRRG